MIVNASHIVSRLPFVESAPLRFPAGYVPSNPHDVATKSFAEQHVEQTNMIYMSKAGCAAGRTADGRTLETAFDNLGDALTAAGALQQELQGESGIPGPSTYVVVYCADASAIEPSTNLTIPLAVSVHAPNTTVMSTEQRTITLANGSNGIVAHSFYNIKFSVRGPASGPPSQARAYVSAVLFEECAIEFPDSFVSAMFVAQFWRTFETAISIAARCTLVFVCTVLETNVAMAATAGNSLMQLWCDSVSLAGPNWTVEAGTLELHNTVPMSANKINITSPGKVYFYGPLNNTPNSAGATYYFPYSQVIGLDYVNPDSPATILAENVQVRCTRDSDSISIYIPGFTITGDATSYLQCSTPSDVFFLEGCAAKTIAIDHAPSEGESPVILLDVAVETIETNSYITIRKTGGAAFGKILTITPTIMSVLL